MVERVGELALPLGETLLAFAAQQRKLPTTLVTTVRIGAPKERRPGIRLKATFKKLGDDVTHPKWGDLRAKRTGLRHLAYYITAATDCPDLAIRLLEVRYFNT